MIGMKKIVPLFIFLIASVALAQSSAAVDKRKAALETELQLVEAEIALQGRLIAIKQQEAATLERDRQLLNSQITKAKLTIKAQELAIARLGGDITQKQETIIQLTERIAAMQQSLAELLRKRRDLEDYSLVEILLADARLDGFYRAETSYQYVQNAIHQLFSEMRTTRVATHN